jgi:hypothetical protein
MTQASITESAYGASNFRIGQIFGRSFGVFGRHFILFCLVSALPALPYLFVAGGQARSLADLSRLGVLFVTAGLLTPITQAVVLYGTFQDMRAKPFGLGESLAKGLARFFPIIGLSICEVLVFSAGAVLLIFPMFIFWAMFAVALPSCVVEKTGPIASLKRSAALTAGYKWKIFGIVLLLGLATVIGSAVVSAVFTLVGGTLAATIGTFIWRALVGAFHSIATAVIYHDLRAAKEGIDVERMAAVFD